MTKISRTLLSTMMSLLLFGAAACTARAAPSAESTGLISLYFADQKLQCTFPAVTQTALFPEDPFDDGSYPCKHLEDGGYIQLRDVPSATRIWLVNGRPEIGQLPPNPKKCSLHSIAAFGWWELKTIKEPTTLREKLRIEDLKTLELGSVVVPGLVLVDNQRYGSPAKPDEINCLIIEVSP
jgi:hypothetical protein